MEAHYQLDDQAFEISFRNGTLLPALFSHEAHLRLAWIHIHRYGEQQAIENICTQLLSFVQALQAADKFNKTLSVAAVKVVYHFYQKSTSDNFQDFIAEFPRLKHNFKALLETHYQMNIYQDERAKQRYLEPDLLPFL